MTKKSIATKFLSALLIVVMLVASLGLIVDRPETDALGGGATVTTTPFVQFCGAYIQLGGVDYLCAVDFGAPVIDSASDTVLTSGTAIRFYPFFCINDAWYAVRSTELQGNPASLFTVSVTKNAGGQCIGTPVWKTYTDDEYGAKYYCEIILKGGLTDTAVDFDVALTQPDVPNVGASYNIKGTVAAAEKCVADFVLGGYTGPCTVDLGAPVTSTGDPAAMTPGSTVCFPLNFLGGDGVWYPALNTEMQNAPASHFTVAESFVSGNSLLTCNGWKTWDNGHYYLEYSVAESETAEALNFTVQLTQPGVYRLGAPVNFTGSTVATVPAPEFCIADINIGGTVYPCVVDIGSAAYGDSNDPAASGSTVVFPLYFLGGDGSWYPVLSGELQGNPANLFTLDVKKLSGNVQLSEPVWKTWDNGHYFVEFTMTNDSYSTESIAMTVQLTQPSAGKAGTVQSASKNIAQTKFYCGADINIGGTVYLCAVDFRDYVTSSGSNDLSGGGTVCLPLYFLGGDGVWYPVLAHELQGDPANLLSYNIDKLEGAELIGTPKWSRWDNGHIFLEIPVASSTGNVSVKFTGTLTQPGNAGVPVTFSGSLTGSIIDVSQVESAAFPGAQFKESNGAWWAVDIGKPYTSSSVTDGKLLADDTIRCDLYFYNANAAAWQRASKDNMIQDPAQWLAIKGTCTSSTGKTVLTNPAWKTDASGNYYIEYTVLDPKEETTFVLAAAITDGTNTGAKYTIKGTVIGGGDESKMNEYIDNLKKTETARTGYEPIEVANLTAAKSTTLAHSFASFTINGVNYAPALWKVDLGAPYANYASNGYVYADSTITFDLMFCVDGAWYSVRDDEISYDPSKVFSVVYTNFEGAEILGKPVFKTRSVDGLGDIWYVEISVLPVEEDTEFSFNLYLKNKNGRATSRYNVSGIATNGTSFAQIPLKQSASLIVERLEECERFNTMPLNIADIRYDIAFPIDFEAPNTTAAVIVDDTVIRANLCFCADGQWYPVRQQECVVSVEDTLTYEYEVLYGEEYLGTPRFCTRYDAIGDIWQFEVGVTGTEEEGDFCFTLRLVSKDGEKLGSLYKITGRVQNGEISISEPEVVAPNVGSIVLWSAVGVVGAAGIALLVILLAKKKKKEEAMAEEK